MDFFFLFLFFQYVIKTTICYQKQQKLLQKNKQDRTKYI